MKNEGEPTPNILTPLTIASMMPRVANVACTQPQIEYTLY